MKRSIESAIRSLQTAAESPRLTKFSLHAPKAVSSLTSLLLPTILIQLRYSYHELLVDDFGLLIIIFCGMRELEFWFSFRK